MYASFFGLKQAPFSIAPDPRYLFLSERHVEALAHLLYGVECGGGFVLLTGAIGAGKTTVCRRFLEQLPSRARVAYIFNPNLSALDLLGTICHELGVEVPQGPWGPASVKDHLDPLNAYLLSAHARGEHSLLVIDEAQNLSPEVLEQLRLLTNLETNEQKLLQIVLIGQPELRQMLARASMEQLNQRVIARFHLDALSEDETRQYVAHRLAVAGRQGPAIFSSDALHRVHALTGGVPRRINLLCDRALLGAYAQERPQVDARTVEQAAIEVFDHAPSGTASPSNTPARPQWPGWLGGAVAGSLLTWALVAIPFPGTRPAETNPAAKAEPQSAAAVDSVAAPAPAAAGPVKTTTAADTTAANQGLPPRTQWVQAEDEAFAALATHWGTTLSANDPCAQAQQKNLQCYRTPRMTWNGLRQMDRPAMLKLQPPGQAAGYLLLTGLGDDVAEFRHGEQRWQVRRSELEPWWKGEYASLWRTPPGSSERINNGYQAPTANWMAQQLGTLQAKGALAPAAATLKEKVEAFQRANGIEINGRASPTTLVLLNRASQVDEPRLTLPAP